MIFNLQRFSTHDGSGIRTIIFYKGCPLRCQWCCNPESQSFTYDLFYDSRICRNFGECLRKDDISITVKNPGIQIDRSALQQPEKFRNICLTKALTVSGEEKSIAELLFEIEKDIPFYRHDGGVTLSGGEPLSQGAELLSLLMELNMRKIDVAVETSLHVSWKNVERCLGLVNTFLVDLKHTDHAKFKAYTQGDAGLILKNIKKLAEQHATIIIRVPVIPDFNHSMNEMKQIIDFVSSLNNVREIHFLPFHTLGVEKYNMLGMEYLFGSNRQVHISELEDYIAYAKSQGIKTKTGG
jgi:pyruvate formate lyase activating enzyme